MASETAFVIDGREYPVPQAFRLGDPVLVSEVTGLQWMDFAELLDEGANDPRVMLGLIAVSVWQANPGWKRDRVARFVEQLAMDQVDFVSPDDDEQENPTVAAEPAATTGSSPGRSEPEPEPASG